MPDPEEVAGYLAQVPPSFRFTCKVPQELTLTHLRGNAGAATGMLNSSFLSPELFARFLVAIEPMLPQTDAIMLEFEYLKQYKDSINTDVVSRLLSRGRTEIEKKTNEQ